MNSTIRAPKEDGVAVVAPLSSPQSLITKNQLRFSKADPLSWLHSSLESSLPELRSAARSEFLKLANKYTFQLDERNSVPDRHGPLILSGHQPEFFHPGVWFKNFLISEIAEKLGGRAINVIIDSDECRTTSIAVPGSEFDRPPVQVPFDAFTSSMPWELRRWQDLETREKFLENVRSHYSANQTPKILLHRVKSEFENTSDGEVENISDWTTSIRRQLELSVGISNLEVPLSWLCRTDAFAQFFGSILVRLDEFWQAYNHALGEHRRVNRIRSEARPVPNLSSSESGKELPFWIWTRRESKRRPLVVIRERHGFVLSDGSSLRIELRAEQWRNDWIRHIRDSVGTPDEIFIRPRALMTTAFLRLMYADLFVHGIGGAKYDEVTDTLIRKFWKVESPHYVTATATYRLPGTGEPPSAGAFQELQRRRRQLQFQPERFLTDRSECRQLIQAKKEWIASRPKTGSCKAWHQHLEQLNKELRAYLTTEIDATNDALDEHRKNLDRFAVTGSREYSFLLHPPELMDALMANAAEVYREVD